MYSEAQISHLFGDSSLKYIKNKHRGGQNNARGNTYENLYAVFKIARIAADDNQADADIKLYSQVLSFVDDLIILSGSHIQHRQLKSGTSLSWGEGPKSLADDFEKQFALNQANHLSSSLGLVVADKQLCQALQDTCPQHLKNYTQVEFFPYPTSLSTLEHQNSVFHTALESLSAFIEPTADQIEYVATVLLGAWVACDQKGISVAEILQKARQLSPCYISSLEPAPPLDSEADAILSKIDKFSFTLAKGFLHWQYGGNIMKGTLPYAIGTSSFKRFQERIKRQKPTTFDELESYL